MKIEKALSFFFQSKEGAFAEFFGHFCLFSFEGMARLLFEKKND
jgi:hypothetical protein